MCLSADARVAYSETARHRITGQRMSGSVARRWPRGCQFLMNIAYQGNKYCGLQRQTRRVDGNNEFTSEDKYDKTIQLAIEIALLKLDPKPVFMTSSLASRTDAGVHALDSYLTARLEHPAYPDQNYSVAQVEDTVNEYLYRNDHYISVKEVQPVAQDFVFGKKTIEWREYAYRFVLQDSKTTATSGPSIPSFVWDRISRIRIHNLDINMGLVESALKCMEGEYSFRSFERCSNVLIRKGWEAERNPIRTMYKVTLTPIDLSTGSVLDSFYKESGPVFEVRFRSTSYLYYQVRRMVGAALMVGTGFIDLDRIKFMLNYGHRWNWQQSYYTAPPDGLYLAKTKFRGVHLIE